MTEEPTTAPITPSSPAHRLAFSILNASTAPVWLAMILFPNARLTGRLVAVSNVVLAGLGVGYTALLAAGVVGGGERIDVRDPDSLRRGLTQPEAFLAGWTHYLAFDLFVGRWIWAEALGAGKRARVALFLTWMLGPLGLTVFLGQRRRW